MKFILQKFFDKQKPPGNERPSAKLARAIEFAKSVANDDPDSLFDIINAFAFHLQYERILNPILNQTQGANEQRHYDQLFKEIDFEWRSIVTERARDWKIELGRDPALVWPWKKDRLNNCLKHIGAGRTRGPWQQDLENHVVSLIAPLGIAQVGGGNHSISTGALRHEGIIRGRRITDISPLINKFRTDGEIIYEVATGRPVGRAGNFLWAILFELGRLAISADAIAPAMRPDGLGNRLGSVPKAQTEEEWKNWLRMDPLIAKAWFLQHVTERVSKIERYEFTEVFSILAKTLATFGRTSISMTSNGTCGIHVTVENAQGCRKVASCSPIYETFTDSLSAITLIQINMITPHPTMSNGLPMN